ncbi:MAG: PaaI family thioesterase [Lachnospiraceae bacterium]|nr:PaaI family thioesterase [Lachnospiraceae bacterium]
MQPLTSIEEVRDFFANDRFATENGAVIEEIGDKYAKCSIIIEPKHLNAMGTVMGGVSFTLADFTFAVASNWQQMGTVSLASNITFYGVCKGKKLIGTAKCVKDGKSTCYYTVDISDELGTMVAAVTFNGFKKS